MFVLESQVFPGYYICDACLDVTITMDIKNIYENVPDSFREELVEIISEKDNVRIERIVSRGHASPDDFWYDQKQNEYVILLKGEARLMFYDRDDEVVLKPGDYIDIAAHVRHSVTWTSPDQETVWLAVYY